MTNDIDVVVCDVGETLIDENRLWTDLALSQGITPFTLMALVGASAAEKSEHTTLWEKLGMKTPLSSLSPEVIDLYPDVRAFLQEMHELNIRIGIAGNQPRGLAASLAEVGVEADFVISSAEVSAAKPDHRFFEAVLSQCRCPATRVLYVGDRLDNDIYPAAKADMKTCHINRGPWAAIQRQYLDFSIATFNVNSLSGLSLLLREE